MTSGRSLARGWRAVAVVWLSALVAIAVLNLVCALAFGPDAAGPAGGDPVAAVPRSPRYESAVAIAVARGAFREKERFFPGRSPADVAALMLESWLLRPYAYEPYTEFREGAYRGRFVNVDAGGFRAGAGPRPPWPPESGATNVFVFGGSTTFGYGLPDAETVPADLERLLARRAGPVRVYNFGRGYYFSTQERVLLQQLLAAGAVPDVAVFVDGLNDFYNTSGEPEFTLRMRTLMARGREAAPPSLGDLLRQLPLARAAARLAGWVVAPAAGASPPAAAPAPGGAVGARQAAQIEAAIARVRANQHLIAALARDRGVGVLFVWQPVPTYGYDLAVHPFAAGLGQHGLSGVGYPRVLELAAAGAFGPSFHSCADIQRGVHEALYIDQVHYTPRMARRVARCIARGLLARGLLARAGTRGTRAPASPAVAD